MSCSVDRTFVSIDLSKLLDKAAGKEKANMFNDAMHLLGGNWAKVIWLTLYISQSTYTAVTTFTYLCKQKESLADRMMPMVLSKLQEKLPNKMTEKMGEKGLVCDITVKSESDEALYFFQQTNPESEE